MALPLLAVLAVAGGSALQAKGIFDAGQAQRMVARVEGQVLLQEAENRRLWSLYNARQQRVKDNLKRSVMSVAYLKSGVTIDPGTTAGMVIERQAAQDEMAAMSIELQGITESSRLRSQAIFSRFRSKQALSAAKRAAFGTVVGGIGQSAVIGIKTGAFQGFGQPGGQSVTGIGSGSSSGTVVNNSGDLSNLDSNSGGSV